MTNCTEPKTLEWLTDYLEAFPTSLGIWSLGDDGVYPTLAWLNRRASSFASLPIAAEVAKDHNRVGVAAEWVFRYMRGTRLVDQPLNGLEEGLEELWSTAGAYWEIDTFLREVRSGLRGFEADKTRFTLPYTADFRLYGLDCWLSQQEDSAQLSTQLGQVAMFDGLAAMAQGIEAGGGDSWFSVPDGIRSSFRSFMTKTASVMKVDVPDETELPPGFTIEELRAYWLELRSLGMYMALAMGMNVCTSSTVAPVYDRQWFVEQVASAAGIPIRTSDVITDVLTMKPGLGADPSLTPLLLLKGNILPMSSLIVPASPVRNTLEILQSSRSAYGPIGNVLGSEGEKVVRNTLDKMSKDTLKAEGLRVMRSKANQAGELDVVVCSPREQCLAVLEVKWKLAVDGTDEAYKSEQDTARGQEQLTRLKNEITSGNAKVFWPADWPDISNFEWKWFVLSRDSLSTHHDDGSDVRIRSNSIIEHMLETGATVKDLIGLLDNPSPPGHVFRRWNTLRLGEIIVDVDVPNLLISCGSS